MADSSMSSCEDDGIFPSQFSALLKPIRELTKLPCWEIHIAEKLDEYIHYIQDLPIEVNVNGEQVKLDFAKAALLVQNTVQIYSRKVENLWVLLQDVISFLSSHKDALSEDQSNPMSKLKKSQKKRILKDKIDLLDGAPLKLRKLGVKSKKKNFTQQKTVTSLPFGILQLEEAMSSFTCLKIKIYSYLKEHIGYPSDLRSNFNFDNLSLFLSISPTSCRTVHVLEIAGNLLRGEMEDGGPDLKKNDDPFQYHPASTIEEQQMSYVDNASDLASIRGDVQSNRSNVWIQENDASHGSAPTSPQDKVISSLHMKDPWQGLEPYVDDKTSNKPCGPEVHYRLPATLQKKKKGGATVDDSLRKDSIGFIDQYLGTDNIKKKFLFRDSRPDDEFWEDYAHVARTIMPIIGQKRQQVKLERRGKLKSFPKEDLTDDEKPPVNKDSLSIDEGWNNNEVCDEFLANSMAGESDHIDESKQFFELVQQYMAEYTASAKGFVHASESMKRVQAWHEMIQPRLQEAESRRDFDIHKYGTEIIEEFGAQAPLGTSCTFSSFVRQKSKGEVARYFLATLQLANAYNVEIVPDYDLNADGIELKLMSRERHHERVEGFHS